MRNEVLKADCLIEGGGEGGDCNGEQLMGIDVLAIVLALGLIMVLSYRVLPVIVFAPVCALLAVAFSGGPLLPSDTETFMNAAAGYIRSFFPLFLLGAIFGKLMETSGAA